jgi:hypothetical protein
MCVGGVGPRHTELLEGRSATSGWCVMNKRKFWQRLECIVYTFVVAAIAFEIVFLIHEILG